ncbi:hypothetical protein PR048_032179 [Dryococelus australis]|uniref:Uncharacterized protein n=1 Tax=Dryococelus australis TaxID=614101 RepID=A0ABQ9G4B5_9NEOP|nr:hypothetical protein PR048_032179 [Dryococelus australis]
MTSAETSHRERLQSLVVIGRRKNQLMAAKCFNLSCATTAPLPRRAVRDCSSAIITFLLNQHAKNKPQASLLDFRTWESCRTMPLASGFSRGSPVSPALAFRCCSTPTSVNLRRSQELRGNGYLVSFHVIHLKLCCSVAAASVRLSRRFPNNLKQLPQHSELWTYRQIFKTHREVLASHQGESGIIPGRVTFGFSRVGIVPDDAAGRRVFSGISRFPRPSVPVLLHTHLNHPHRLSRTSLLKAAQLSSLTLIDVDILNAAETKIGRSRDVSGEAAFCERKRRQMNATESTERGDSNYRKDLRDFFSIIHSITTRVHESRWARPTCSAETFVNLRTLLALPLTFDALIDSLVPDGRRSARAIEDEDKESCYDSVGGGKTMTGVELHTCAADLVVLFSAFIRRILWINDIVLLAQLRVRCTFEMVTANAFRAIEERATSGREVCDCQYQVVKDAAGRLDYWTRCMKGTRQVSHLDKLLPPPLGLAAMPPAFQSQVNSLYSVVEIPLSPRATEVLQTRLPLIFAVILVSATRNHGSQVLMLISQHRLLKVLGRECTEALPAVYVPPAENPLCRRGSRRCSGSLHVDYQETSAKRRAIRLGDGGQDVLAGARREFPRIWKCIHAAREVAWRETSETREDARQELKIRPSIVGIWQRILLSRQLASSPARGMAIGWEYTPALSRALSLNAVHDECTPLFGQPGFQTRRLENIYKASWNGSFDNESICSMWDAERSRSTSGKITLLHQTEEKVWRKSLYYIKQTEEKEKLIIYPLLPPQAVLKSEGDVIAWRLQLAACLPSPGTADHIFQPLERLQRASGSRDFTPLRRR